jgi:dihydrofolate reductase
MGEVVLEMSLKQMDDAEAIGWMVHHIRRAGAHLMGSNTYREMAAYWPYHSSPFADPMNRIPKVVASRSGDPAISLPEGPGAGGGDVSPTAEVLESWRNPVVLGGALGPEIAALKKRIAGEIILHGGFGFVRSMLDAELVDEYRFIVPPGGEDLIGNILRPAYRARTKPLLVHRFSTGAAACVFGNIERAPGA